MKGFKSIPVKLKCEPITIKEPYNPDVKTFNDTDEFTRYFRSNEDAFKEPSSDPEKPPKYLTANKLNRTYKIPGYRIRISRKGTDNEELTLVKDYYSKNIDNADESLNEDTYNAARLREAANNELIERVNRMDETIQQLVDQVANIEAFLMQLKR